MRPAAFTYSRPASLADALRALAAGAVPLAGGQSLLQAMRLRAATPRAIVDLAGVAELSDAITVDHESANMAVALLASDALVTAVAPSHGETVDRIALGDFFTGFRSHALNGRLATSIELPHSRGARGAYLEFSRQRQDLALVNVCVVRGAGHARVAVGGIDPMPVRLPEVEAAIVDGDGADVVHALHENLVRGRHAPPVDHHGSDEYKLGLAVTLVKRALALCEASP